jgi:hypothetical protein
MFYVPECFLENLAVCEITWKNIVEPNRLQMTKWRMNISCWISKATNTHSDYVILPSVPSIPLQLWLHGRASVLRCACVPCLSVCLVSY